MIGEPSDKAPAAEAIAAVPMLMITALRSPARIKGNASGNSTFKRTSRGAKAHSHVPLR